MLYWSPYGASKFVRGDAVVMALNTFLFCMLVAFIFWAATMGDKAKAAASSKGSVEPGTIPAMAGRSSALDGPEAPVGEIDASERKRPV